MKRLAMLLAALAIVVTACAPVMQPTPTAPDPAQPRTLIVFAAASLTEAFTEMGRAFQAAHPGVTVSFNFAGSQTLRTQMEQGAPADVFASANHFEMDAAVKDGLVQGGAVQDFLTNRLIVILPPNDPGGVASLQDLARPGLKLVLADPAVPAGKYARQALDNMSRDPAFGAGFAAGVLANVASNEIDVKQVVAKIAVGEGDAGIVYVSDAVAAPQLKTLAIPPALNAVARYPIAPLAKSSEPALAAAFVAYVLSPGGQATLHKWGFTPVE